MAPRIKNERAAAAVEVMNRCCAPPPAGTAKLLGVVLAGGRSARMGADKAALRLHCPLDREHAAGGREGVSYLQHALQRLQPLVARLAVAGRDQQQLRLLLGSVGRVLALPDSEPDQGPARGLLQAIQAAASLGLDAVLVTPVDMPDLTRGDLGAIVDCWRRRDGIACASFTESFPEPLVAVYPTSALAGIARLVDSPHRSLSRWLGDRQVHLVTLPRASATNVNRPQDIGR